MRRNVFTSREAGFPGREDTALGNDAEESEFVFEFSEIRVWGANTSLGADDGSKGSSGGGSLKGGFVSSFLSGNSTTGRCSAKTASTFSREELRVEGLAKQTWKPRAGACCWMQLSNFFEEFIGSRRAHAKANNLENKHKIDGLKREEGDFRSQSRRCFQFEETKPDTR